MSTVNGTDGNTPDKWIRRFGTSEDAPVRLVCFPHAGGSASFYFPVASTHGKDAEVITLQYPARQDRRQEPAIDNIADYAEALTEVLATLPAKPTVFFGHSMGAVLGFEVAHRLEQRGSWAPGSLIASGRRGPSTVRDERVHQRDEDGVIEELQSLNGTGAAIFGDPEIMRMAMPAIRNDYRAIETYQGSAEQVIGCPITVLIGADDPKSTIEEARRWEDHTTGEFRLREFPGGHFFLSTEQAGVNEEIAAELKKVGTKAH